jgi:hypothetical protein
MLGSYFIASKVTTCSVVPSITSSQVSAVDACKKQSIDCAKSDEDMEFYNSHRPNSDPHRRWSVYRQPVKLGVSLCAFIVYNFAVAALFVAFSGYPKFLWFKL